MKKSIWKVLAFLPSVCLIVVILSLSWNNKSIVLGVTKEALSALNPYVLTENLEKRLTDGLEERYDYIELNGWMTKMLGIHDLNLRQKLASGYLASYADYNVESAARKGIPQFSVFLEEAGIDFLCVSVPTKVYSHDAEVAPGYEALGPEKYAVLPEAMEVGSVPYLDLDGWFAEEGWGMEETYYRSDHHWLPEAAFAATGKIMETLAERYAVSYEKGSLDLQNWNIEVLENWFLGSDGRRTGASYSGLDDLTYIYPKEAGEVTVSRINAEGSLDVENLHTLYDTKYLTAPSGYDWNSYCLYLGGDYPLTHIKNDKAANQKKLLVMGDSYRLPVECFLSTQFSEIYHLDNRYYQGGSQAEYIRQIDPDVVLLLFCIPGSRAMHQFGLDIWQENYAGKQPGQSIYEMRDLILTKKNQGDFYVVEANLEPGAYEMILEEAEQSMGYYTQFSLMDLVSGKIVGTRYFMLNYQDSQKWYFTVPEEAGNYAVVAYRGMSGQTAEGPVSIGRIAIAKFE